MPTASINLTPQNGNASVVAINCGTSSPKLSGTINISPYLNISSFTCINNDIERINSLAVNPLLQVLRLENNNLSKENLETLTTSISNNRASIISSANKNINFSLTGVRMGKMDRLIRLDNVNKYQAQLDKQGFNIVYAVNGETDQTWNGAGADNNLGTAANWANNASPLTYDALYFGGTTRLNIFNNLPVDTELNGITFNPGAGAFTLSGNRFVLTFDGINNNSTNTQTICADMVLSGSNRTINCATSAIALSGVISGNSSLTKTGSAVLTLGGNNTYAGGTRILNGEVRAVNNNALGAQTGIISVLSSGQLNLSSSNIVINNPMQIAGRGNLGQNDQLNGAIISTAGINTINGPISAVGGRSPGGSWIRTRNSTLTIAGGISASGEDTVTLTSPFNTSNTQIFITQTPLNINSRLVCFDQNTTRPVVFNVANNRVGLLTIYYGGRVITNVPNAFGEYPANTILQISNNDSSTLSILELSGNNLNIGTLTQTYILPNINPTNGIIVNNATTICDFTINQTDITSGLYTGTLSGNFNLTKGGSATLTLSAGTNLGVTSLGPRYTGFTAISAGTLINYALSSNPGNKVSFAQFTRTALTVNFAIPPSIGDTFTLLPGSTINTYPTVSLINATGRTGTYNSTNSRLTIS